MNINNQEIFKNRGLNLYKIIMKIFQMQEKEN